MFEMSIHIWYNLLWHAQEAKVLQEVLKYHWERRKDGNWSAFHPLMDIDDNLELSFLLVKGLG